MRPVNAFFILISALLLASPAPESGAAGFGDAKQGVMEGRRAPQVEYSADKFMETEQVTMQEKIYSTPDKERSERESGGMKMISITRHDKKVTWLLIPDQMMYMETAFGEEKNEEVPDISRYKVEYTVVGAEVVNGINTTKSKIIAVAPDGNKFGGFMWTTKEGIELKMDIIGKGEAGKARIKTELKNLKIGRQDQALFEIPPGYRKMSMGGFPGVLDSGDKNKSKPNMPAEEKNNETPPEDKSKKDGGTDFKDLFNKMKEKLGK